MKFVVNDGDKERYTWKGWKISFIFELGMLIFFNLLCLVIPSFSFKCIVILLNILCFLGGIILGKDWDYVMKYRKQKEFINEEYLKED